MTMADDFLKSSKTKELLSALTQEFSRAQGKLTRVLPALPELEASYKQALDHLQAIRGRNFFYPYLGSGMGSGPYVELMDGSVKLDMINGIGIHIMGHGHSSVIEASLEGALQDVVMQGNLQPNREYAELLDFLVDRAGRKSRLRRGWIGTCGTIVNENALKIARQKNSPARKILTFHDSFAGRSTMMAEITDNAEYRQGLPAYNEVLYLPFYDKKDPLSSQKTLDALKKHILENPKDIGVFVFEIVQGEGGFNVAPAEFFIPLLKLCRENKIAVWADEVQTFSRTGEFFAFETFGLGEYLDIVTVAKTAQCGAVLYTEEYNPKPGLIAGTFTASTVSMRAGLKILKTLADQNYLGENGRIKELHEEFISMLRDLKAGSCHDYIQDFGGIGLMVSMTPYDGSKDKVSKLLQRLFKNGLMAFSCGHGPFKLRFLIPAILESKHITEIKGILEKSLIEGAKD